MTAGVPASVAEAFAGVEGLVALLLAGAVLAWPWRSTALPAGLDSSARLAGPVPGATRPRSVRAVGRRHGIPGAPAAPAIADALELVALVLGAGGGLVDAVEAVARTSKGVVCEHLTIVAAAVRWGMPWSVAWGAVDDAWARTGVMQHSASSTVAARTSRSVIWSIPPRNRAAGDIYRTSADRLQPTAFPAGDTGA